MRRLLAKSAPACIELTDPAALYGHTRAVLEAAETLAELLHPEFGRLWGCTSLESTQWVLALRIAAWMHDWGKANGDFQRLVCGEEVRQGIRHEALSVLMAAELDEWLAPLWSGLPEWSHWGILFAAAGHHVKFPDELERPGVSVVLHWDHADFRDVLAIGVKEFGLPPPPQLSNASWSLLRGGVPARLKKVQQLAPIGFNDKEKCLIGALKATLLCADLAGSALPRVGMHISDWISARLANSMDASMLSESVLARIGARPLHAFQIRAQASKCPTVLLEAGCGTGKTAAAWLWAANRTETQRVFFCYPTTGTASEGFLGYAAAPELDGLLVHSRARADYQLLHDFPSRSKENQILHFLKMEALDLWPSSIVVCTAHTVLGLLENTRRGLYGWPSIAQAAFVFDEIHAYSDKLFGYLLRFLRVFQGAPILLMTASLPGNRRSAIHQACKHRGGLDTFRGPDERERALRYRLTSCDEEMAWKEATAVARSGGKVLWICNTVSRARAAFDKAVSLNLAADLYHSRYRYCDRVVRHQSIMAGFRSTGTGLIAVTTQVAEMSLDLSADLLVTEMAPVPALIQRLGRLNRFEAQPVTAKPCLFVPVESRMPYDAEEWTGLDAWMDAVADGTPRSQRDLAEAFASLPRDPVASIETPWCAWLDGLWRTHCDRSVEEGGYTVEVIRREDLGKASPVELAVPMPFPRHLNWQDWPQEGRFLVAPMDTIEYDEKRGAQWVRN